VLNYVDSPIVAPYFAVFVSIWIYLRHYINLRIFSALFPLPLGPLLHWLTNLVFAPSSSVTISPGQQPSPFPSSLSSSSFSSTDLPRSLHHHLSQTFPLFPAWNAQFATTGPYDVDWAGQQYKCWISHLITFALLAALQAVNLFWLFLILRIGWRFVVTKEVEDERSEYDETEGELEERLAALAEADADVEGHVSHGRMEVVDEKSAVNVPEVTLNGVRVTEELMETPPPPPSRNTRSRGASKRRG